VNCSTGYKCWSTTSGEPYAGPLVSGDKVGVQIDIEAKTVEYFKNDVSLGIAFSNLNPPVVFAISTVEAHRIKIIPQPTPESNFEGGKLDVWSDHSKRAHLADASVEWFQRMFAARGFHAMPFLATGAAGAQQTVTASELDAYINQFLWVVLHCCHSPQVRESVSKSAWVKALLQMTNRSSSKLRQLLAIRICRYILPLVAPTDPRILRATPGGGSSMVTEFLRRIGLSLLSLSSSSTKS